MLGEAEPEDAPAPDVLLPEVAPVLDELSLLPDEAPDFGSADGLALLPVSAAPVLPSMPSLAMVSASRRPVAFRPSLL